MRFAVGFKMFQGIFRCIHVVLASVARYHTYFFKSKYYMSISTGTFCHMCGCKTMPVALPAEPLGSPSVEMTRVDFMPETTQTRCL